MVIDSMQANCAFSQVTRQEFAFPLGQQKEGVTAHLKYLYLTFLTHK
jgi:hypothetical protein